MVKDIELAKQKCLLLQGDFQWNPPMNYSYQLSIHLAMLWEKFDDKTFVANEGDKFQLHC